MSWTPIAFKEVYKKTFDLSRFFLPIVFLLSFADTYSQKVAITYYDSMWRLTSKEFGQYYRVGVIDTKEFKYFGQVSDYFLDGHLQMKGKFNANIKTDSFYFYYPTGSLKTKGRYKDNVRYGIWISYYEDGKIKDKTLFNGDFVCALEFFDKEGTPQMINGTGVWRTQYFDDMVGDLFEIEGQYKDTLRHGVWKSYQTSLAKGNEKRLLCVEEYENGKFVKGKYYWGGGGIQDIHKPTMHILPETIKFENMERWASNKYASIEAYPYLKFLPKLDSTILPVDKLAEFPGGLDSLTTLFRKNIKLPKSYIASQKLRSAMFKIVVDTKGKIKITEETSKSSLMTFPDNQLFYDQSLKAIRKLPNWTPAKRNKKNVINYFLIWVSMDDGIISIHLISDNRRKS